MGDIERRIAHLELLRKQNWNGNDFSLCDDAESNQMIQYCFLHFEALSKIKRENKLKSMQTKWTSKEKAEYGLLRKAASRYFDAHTTKEFDENGHESGAQSTAEKTALEEGFLSFLQEIYMEELPSTT